MSTLVELGLKEIIRENTADFSAGLYLEGGRILAWIIIREPPMSKECLINASCIHERRSVPDLTDEQFARVLHWYQCHCKAGQVHFAKSGRTVLQTVGSFTTFHSL